MSLIGFVCKNGEKVNFETCLKRDCRNCLPLVFRMGMLARRQERSKEISATSLNGCLRKTFWERTRDYYDAPSKLYFAYRGTLAHSVLEFLLSNEKIGNKSVEEIIASYKKNIIVEQRLYREIKGLDIEISGQFDLLILQEPATLIDYKTVNSRQIPYLLKEGARKDHITQLNVYKWIAKPIVEVKRLQIVYLAMEAPYFTGGEFEVKRKLKGQTVYEQKEIAEVPIMPEKEVEDFIYKKAEILQKAFTQGIVPEKIGDEGKWLCNFCPFVSECN